jgi:uncharacterized protein
MTSVDRVQNSAGIGLRLPHIAEMAATRPSTAWLEIHPENFLANPHATELLIDLAQDYRVSFHTVGISVGSASGVDRLHLKRIRELMEKIEPIFVSGHLAWSSYGTHYLNDLLPLPYDDETLDVVGAHIHQVQEALHRPYLLENPASYVGFAGSKTEEVEFLSELVVRTGCRLLCDVSNIYVSAHNMGLDARRYIDGLPPGAIAELHLGGFTPEEDEAKPGADLLVDTHAASIAEPCWDLYAYALARFGQRPTLIEWDNDLPALATVLNEARRADEISKKVIDCEVGCAGA